MTVAELKILPEVKTLLQKSGQRLIANANDLDKIISETLPETVDVDSGDIMTADVFRITGEIIADLDNVINNLNTLYGQNIFAQFATE